MTKNLTTGNPAKLILIFTLPLIIGNIFQQFYSMADTLIVGRTIGVNALAAVGCTGFPSSRPSALAPRILPAYGRVLPPASS